MLAQWAQHAQHRQQSHLCATVRRAWSTLVASALVCSVLSCFGLSPVVFVFEVVRFVVVVLFVLFGGAPLSFQFFPLSLLSILETPPPIGGWLCGNHRGNLVVSLLQLC